MDERLINFYENNKATAATLRNIIRSKQRFPKDEFLKTKRGLPVYFSQHQGLCGIHPLGTGDI